ncbi:MAG: hypothetical protein CFE24_03620 [Flavobacterium sp. BFFFF2]|nr:MAG: hypothetical protein CFE24_03620 [Flavobacterium sp. BFFFF2]
MIHQIKETAFWHLKNLGGKRTSKKLVVFSVDDYGNVRLDSPQARTNMDAAGMPCYSRFDALDTLETAADLEALYEVLRSVKDSKGNHAVFTPFALPCNIDFEKMAADDYQQFFHENLPDTYSKLEALQPAAYQGAWKLWQQGMAEGIMSPEFHGREHLNLILFHDKLNKKSPDLLTALKNRSYTSISEEGYPTISSTAAFDFATTDQLEPMKKVIQDGLNRFEAVYGKRSHYFTPPVYSIHHSLYPTLVQNGVTHIDLGLMHREHQGNGVYKKSLNYMGKNTHEGLQIMVRNIVFEPTEDRGIDWVQYTLRQMEAAFRMKKPAVISSHRVNFCGHIDPKNRQKGLETLKKLLQEMLRRWPDIEFVSAQQLTQMI